MSKTKRNRKKLTTPLDSTSKLLPENVFPFVITLIANEIQRRFQNDQFSKSSIYTSFVSSKQKKFASPTLRQSSQLGKRDRNTNTTIFLSITVLSVPEKKKKMQHLVH